MGKLQEVHLSWSFPSTTQHLDFPLAFSQVGRVLDELDSLGYEKDTVVVISADHGWQLGEHGLWDKQTEFELATRVPLLIKVRKRWAF